MRVAIVEDDRLCAERIQNYLQTYAEESGQKFEITLYSDGDEIVENYRAEYEMILMDIEMEYMDGMTTARKIREQDQEVVIIFITNMAQYAIQGYEVDASDYILKPVSYFAFTQRLGRAISRMKKREKKYLVINAKNQVTRMDVSDIFWIESRGHRLTYHTRDGLYESTVNTMKEVEEKLADSHFFRCNKCYLVNLEHVKGIRDGCAVVHDSQILISRAKKGEFQRVLAEYLGEVIK